MISRRTFLEMSAAAAAAGFAGKMSAESVTGNQHAGRTRPSEIYKSRITGVPTEKYCEELQVAGFAGMEVRQWDIPAAEAKANRQIAEKFGLRVHSVMLGWTDVNKPDKYAAGIESVKTAVRTAAVYGADTVLWVPCLISGMKMPEAWDFDVDFDPQTLKVKTVAEGDNAPYADYIAAHNAATEASVRAAESLIPFAAKEGVRLGLENVWSHLWCTPKFFAAFCKYFDNPWIGCYFDLGNHTKYSRCEEWVKALGSSIIKLHIKGFKVKEVKGKSGGGPGNWCRIDEATIQWSAVRKLLAETGYSGWVSVEENYTGSKEYSQILDRVLTLPQ
jgi:hexulose-6-phosphate isomerase